MLQEIEEEMLRQQWADWLDTRVRAHKADRVKEGNGCEPCWFD
jgi:hypothetical protein